MPSSVWRLAPAAMLLLAACAPEPELAIRPLTTASRLVASAPFQDAYDAGKDQLRANRVALALAFFDRALAIDPKSVAALNAVGACYDELHLTDQAAPYYQRALAIEPGSADTLNNMGMSALIGGRPGQARALFRRALAIAPDNATIAANLALTEELRHKPVKRHEKKLAKPTRPTIEQVGLSSYRIVTRGVPQP